MGRLSPAAVLALALLGAAPAQALEAQAGGGEGDERSRRFCPPAGEDAGRVVGRVIRHLQDHPESLDGPAARVVAEALGQAYPCGD